MSAALFELEAVAATVPGRTLPHPPTLALAPGRPHQTPAGPSLAFAIKKNI